MNNKSKCLCSLVAGMMIGGLTVVGANQAIQAIQNYNIKVSLNGKIQEFKDETTGETQYPITYNNRTYLPLRNIANLTGLDVSYNQENNTAILENDIIKEIITKAEKELPNSWKDENGRKVVKAYVRGIEIADNTYIKTVSDAKKNNKGDFTDVNSLEYGNISYDGVYNYLTENPNANFPVYGKIVFMLEYDKDFEGYWAGNGPTYYSGKYAIGERLFTYENGKLYFATGGGPLYSEYENNQKTGEAQSDNKSQLASNDSKKQIGKIAESTIADVREVNGVKKFFFDESEYIIDGLEGKKIKKSLLYFGPQVLSNSTIVVLCDDGLYFVRWADNEIGTETNNGTIYAKKIQTKSNIEDILTTEFDTGNIFEGFENYVLVQYKDGNYEEIYVNNDRMAS